MVAYCYMLLSGQHFMAKEFILEVFKADLIYLSVENCGDKISEGRVQAI
jgi:hypothetical protein